MHTNIGIANWTEDGLPLRLVVTLELRSVGGEHSLTTEHQVLPAGSLELSATHTVIDRRKRKSDWYVSGGAGIPELPVDAEFDPGWNVGRFSKLRTIANNWHLNGLRAGCAHQEIVWEEGKYGRQMSLTETLPCPETDYRFGSAWLVEPLPQDVIDYLKDLGVKEPE